MAAFAFLAAGFFLAPFAAFLAAAFAFLAAAAAFFLAEAAARLAAAFAFLAARFSAAFAFLAAAAAARLLRASTFLLSSLLSLSERRLLASLSLFSVTFASFAFNSATFWAGVKAGFALLRFAFFFAFAIVTFLSCGIFNLREPLSDSSKQIICSYQIM